jgi:hypothetical protein
MDVFSTGVLARVVAELEQPSSFLLDLFFPNTQSEDSEEIHFDIDQSKARITPFVAPIRAGRVADEEGFKTGTFSPAYAKDKRIFDPDRPMKRAIGEAIGGNLTPQERRDMAVRRAVEDQLRMLTRREEVMAAEVLRTGKVTVSGDGYPTTVVDYGRDANLTVTLTSTLRWNDSAPTPLNDIEDWADLVMQKSGGVVTDVVMDTDAWQNFRDKTEVKDLLDTRRGSRSQAELGPRAARKARYGGAIGDFDIWIYNDRYVDDDDTEQLFLPSGTVILSGPALEGVRAYGAIKDEKAQYTALRYFIKSWLEEDPAVRFLLLQSAPLVVPYRVNASLCATVL